MGAKNELHGLSGIIIGQEMKMNIVGDAKGKTFQYWYRLPGEGWTEISSPIFTLPLEGTGKKFPNDFQILINLCLRTHENGKNLGDSYWDELISFPSDAIPTASITNVIDSNTSTASAGQFLLGMSTLQADVGGAGIYGSTIRSTNVTVNGLSVNVDGGKITIPCNEKKFTISVTVTDSRGKKASAKKEITVYEYAQPRIYEYKVYRCTKNGTPDENGGYFCAEFLPDATIYPGNSLSFTIEEQKEGDSGWRLCSRKNGLTTWGTLEEISAIEQDFTHTIKLTLKDKVKEVFFTQTLLPTFSIIDIAANGMGISFGRSCEEDGFTCALASKFTKPMILEKDGTVITNKGSKKIGATLDTLQAEKSSKIWLKDGYDSGEVGGISYKNQTGYNTLKCTMRVIDAPGLSNTSVIFSNNKKPAFYFAWMQSRTGYNVYMLPWKKTSVTYVTEKEIGYLNEDSSNWENFMLHVLIFYYD